ncbi:MAG: energy transducer TonB [Betaproteobacteria bacterium]|nr:energy transducer TonB [Betaproteobacteria bacterium]MDH5212089.1 energy transducer TonB [Betaproteobacteria bacterium]
MIDARIPIALGASLMLHGAALALVDRLPHGGRLAAPERMQWGAGALHARLRAPASEATAVSAPQAPAARGAARSGDGAKQVKAISSGIAVAPKYYPAQELDERPLIRTPVYPEFPADAPVASGRVVLRLLINEAGAVDEAKVLRASPAGVFDAAAMEAFAPARFIPGRKDGAAVRSAVTLELRFGEALPALAQTRTQEVPLFQAPQRARRPQSTFPQEKP